MISGILYPKLGHILGIIEIMFKKIVKEYNTSKDRFNPGDKVLCRRTNEIVTVSEHSLPNVVTILISRESRAFREDYKYLDLWQRTFPSHSYKQPGTVEVSVAQDELLKLPNSTIANLLYD